MMTVIMRRLLLIAVLMFPVFAFAQDAAQEDCCAVDQADCCVEAYVTRHNALCPIDLKDGWAFNSFVKTGDTTIVQLEVPYILGGFLIALTPDTDNARALWMKQLKSMYGDQWRQLVQLLVAEKGILRIEYFIDDEKMASLTYTTAHLRK